MESPKDCTVRTDGRPTKLHDINGKGNTTRTKEKGERVMSSYARVIYKKASNNTGLFM